MFDLPWHAGGLQLDGALPCIEMGAARTAPVRARRDAPDLLPLVTGT
jgi:hypothetical protein